MRMKTRNSDEEYNLRSQKHKRLYIFYQNKDDKKARI